MVFVTIVGNIFFSTKLEQVNIAIKSTLEPNILTSEKGIVPHTTI